MTARSNRQPQYVYQHGAKVGSQTEDCLTLAFAMYQMNQAIQFNPAGVLNSGRGLLVRKGLRFRHSPSADHFYERIENHRRKLPGGSQPSDSYLQTWSDRQVLHVGRYINAVCGILEKEEPRLHADIGNHTANPDGKGLGCLR